MREAKCELCNWYLSIDCIDKQEICENFEPVDPVEEDEMVIKDILNLIDINGESMDQIILSPECEEETWLYVPAWSKLIKPLHNVEVGAIETRNGKLQLWIGELDEEQQD